MTSKNNKRALLVGINYVNTHYRLNGCANDQEEIYRLLVRQGYSKENILFLCDDSSMSHGQPNLKNMEKALRWLLSGAGVSSFSKEEKSWPALSASQLFFSFSGHGSYIRDNSHTETDGRDEVLIPLDYVSSGVTMKDDYLRDELINKIPSNVRLTSIIDCCHSGTMLDLRWKVENTGKKDHLLTFNPKRSETEADIIMLSGCLDSQTASENYYKRKPFGLLTSFFLQYMTEVKNKTSCIDLLNYVNKNMTGQRSLLTMGKNRSLYSEFNL